MWYLQSSLHPRMLSTELAHHKGSHVERMKKYINLEIIDCICFF